MMSILALALLIFCLILIILGYLVLFIAEKI